MKLNEYQRAAHLTAKRASVEGSDIIVPILGLAGEVGELLNEYKKKLRDGDSHTRFPDRVSEELGDVLWYVAETATRFNLSLEDVASQNLAKTQARFGPRGEGIGGPPHIFDAEFPESERFPRSFCADFRPWVDSAGITGMRVFVEGRQLGQSLTDNAHAPDGYRIHDAFHLSCAALLGWSPVTRRNLGLKRRSCPRIDEVEDGGRAIVTEEGISALVFAIASDHRHFDGVTAIDYNLLKAIRYMTAYFEVSICSAGEWEQTILRGYEVWKQVEANQGGKVELNLDKRTITYVGM